MIREHVIENFPVGPGDNFLGEIDRRRWHSVQTASKEHGMHPLRLGRLLQEAGFIDPALKGLSDHRLVFEAETANAFLRQMKDTVMTREAENHAGMSRVQWETVVQAGLVKPIVQPGRVHPTYAKREIDAFLATVAYRTGHGDLTLMVPVARARKLATCTLLAILELLQERQLDHVALDPNRKGFAAVLVDANEVKAKLPRKELPGLTPQMVAERLGINATVVSKLFTLGYIRHQTLGEFSNRSGTRIATPEDADAFAREYVSLPQATEMGGYLSSKYLKKQFDERGIQPAIEKSVAGGIFYRRESLADLNGRSL